MNLPKKIPGILLVSFYSCFGSSHITLPHLVSDGMVLQRDAPVKIERGTRDAINKNKVIVWSDEISHPVSIQYALADHPERANLNNKEGLPTSPFSTE